MSEPRLDPVHLGQAERWGGWSWDRPASGEHFRRCSYCGSIRPEDLAAEPAWKAEWADRKYNFPHKFYIDIPNRSPATLFVIGSHRGCRWPAPAPGARPGGAGWVAFERLTRQQRALARRDGWSVTRDDHSDYYQFGTRAAHYAKFYTMHLADPDVSETARETIQRVSGLCFEFAGDGSVRWRPHEDAAGEATA
jgi:hypothetical protein